MANQISNKNNKFKFETPGPIHPDVLRPFKPIKVEIKSTDKSKIRKG